MVAFYGLHQAPQADPAKPFPDTTPTAALRVTSPPAAVRLTWVNSTAKTKQGDKRKATDKPTAD